MTNQCHTRCFYLVSSSGLKWREKKFKSALFRVPIPNFDNRAFREVFVSALVHRDYCTLGALHVKLGEDGLSISTPGGFVKGVNLDNLLVAEPRSAPDFTMTSTHTVSARMSVANGDTEFLRGRRLKAADLAGAVQKSEAAVWGILEKLVETGVLEARGD